MREATENPTSQKVGLNSSSRNFTLVSLDDLAGRKSLHLYEFVLQPHGPMKRRCCFSLKHLFCAVGILSGIAAAILWQFRRIEGECEVEKITIRQLETSKSVDFVSAIPEWLQGLERFICGKNNDYIVGVFCKGVDSEGHAPITDVELGLLSKCTHLQAASVSRSRITSAGIAILAKLPDLNSLDISHCFGVTDDAIPSLISMHHLERLDVTGTKISSEGIQHLRKALPDCCITHHDL